MTQIVHVRCKGGPLDGREFPFPKGYLQEGESEAIDFMHKHSARWTPEVVYCYEGGVLVYDELRTIERSAGRG